MARAITRRWSRNTADQQVINVVHSEDANDPFDVELRFASLVSHLLIRRLDLSSSQRRTRRRFRGCPVGGRRESAIRRRVSVGPRLRTPRTLRRILSIAPSAHGSSGIHALRPSGLCRRVRRSRTGLRPIPIVRRPSDSAIRVHSVAVSSRRPLTTEYARQRWLWRSRGAGSRRCLQRSCRSSSRGATSPPGSRARSRSHRGSGSPAR